jgi:hypothetical protein
VWRSDRILHFAEPPADVGLVDDLAAAWAADVAEPLQVTITPYAP